MKKYLIAIIFYFAGSLIISIPVVISFLTQADGFEPFDFIRNTFAFKANLPVAAAMVLFFTLVIIIDMIVLTRIKNSWKTIRNIEMLLGNKNKISLNFILCLLTGFFEETLFRVIIYSFTAALFGMFLERTPAAAASVITVSAVFSLFHITQGAAGIIMSFIISVVFFISVFLTGTIWYAIFFHFIFNFAELSFVFPYQKKKMDMTCR